MSSEIPLYKSDPEAWRAHLAEGNAKQPRKRVSVDAIIRDTFGRLLLVDPTYKPDWDTPGGMAEANEPPHLAVQREVREELGLNLRVDRLLCVDWVAPHGPWDDLIVFIFDGGMLTEQQISTLQPADNEVAAFEFCDEEQAAQRLRPYVWQRIKAALDALTTGTTQYLNSGSAVLS
ncbi:MAG: NUDIX hydrolase [Acidobacteria bacterium]|nr:NUDIX hydrolase [Acidobacteriota bacterium]